MDVSKELYFRGPFRASIIVDTFSHTFKDKLVEVGDEVVISVKEFSEIQWFMKIYDYMSDREMLKRVENFDSDEALKLVSSSSLPGYSSRVEDEMVYIKKLKTYHIMW